MTDILFGSLFYKVFHNKYIRTRIFSFFPIYVFVNQSTVCSGSAKWKGDENNSVIITHDKKTITGGCWAKNPILFNQDITISFDFQMIAKGTPADGIAIVFLKDHNYTSNKFTRNIGGNLGYKGYINGIAAIEFDIYNNSEENDPNDNHIAIQSVDNTYTPPRLSTHNSCTLATASPDYKLNNGEIHRVNILYNHDSKSFSIVLNYKLLIGNTQIPELINHKENDNVYIGVTGATGLYYQTQIISNFQILKPKY